MKIVVLGSGAMASLFGGYLSLNNDVYIIGRGSGKMAFLDKNGIQIKEKDSTIRTNPHCTSDYKIPGTADLIILFVKSMANESVLSNAAPLIGEKTAILTFQNGAGHENVMNRFISKDRILIGTTQHSANIIEEGVVNHANGGLCTVGYAYGKDKSPEINKIAEALNKAGFETKISDDVKKSIWSKLLNNTSISITTAVLGCSMEYLAKSKDAWAIVSSLVRETVSVAKASGYTFDAEKTIADLFTLCSNVQGGYTSIYTDVKQGRKTEVDRISGFVVEEAKRLGVDAPLQTLMVNAVHALENKTK